MGDCCVLYDFIINVLDIMSIINIIMTNAEYEYMGDMNYDDVLDILDMFRRAIYF